MTRSRFPALYLNQAPSWNNDRINLCQQTRQLIRQLMWIGNTMHLTQINTLEGTWALKFHDELDLDTLR